MVRQHKFIRFAIASRPKFGVESFLKKRVAGRLFCPVTVPESLALSFLNPCEARRVNFSDANWTAYHLRFLAFLCCDAVPDQPSRIVCKFTDVSRDVSFRRFILSHRKDAKFGTGCLWPLTNDFNFPIGFLSIQNRPCKARMPIFEANKQDLEQGSIGKEICEVIGGSFLDRGQFIGERDLRFAYERPHFVVQIPFGMGCAHNLVKVKTCGRICDERRGNCPIESVFLVDLACQPHRCFRSIALKAIGSDPNIIATVDQNNNCPSAIARCKQYEAERDQFPTYLTGTADDIDITGEGKAWFHFRGNYCRRHLSL